MMNSVSCCVALVFIAGLVPASAGAQSRPASSPPSGKAVPRGTPPTTSTPAPTPSPTPAPLSASDLFNPNEVHDLHLTVNSRDWTQLKEEFRENTYYLADVRWRDQVVRNVGIRSRGRGTRNEAKPGLRVDFNRYSTDQEFLGLKSLVLDNFAQDASMIKERIAMLFFEEMGIRAPRVVHARLFVNGEYVGLYGIVESVDKRFLERQLGEDDGYLYEYKWDDPYRFEYLGPDLEPYARFFVPKTHETDSMFALFRPIREMVWAISESPSGQFVAAASEYLDLELFMTYVAVENFLADGDGMLGKWGMNNFYLYRFEGKTRSQVIPWDKDSTFRSFDHDIWDQFERNALTKRAMRETALRDAYVTALRRCAEIALRASGTDDGGWLERQIAFMSAQIGQAAAADPRKPYTNGQVEGAIGDLLEFARRRPAFVLQHVGSGQ